jgi:cell division protein FtsL
MSAAAEIGWEGALPAQTPDRIIEGGAAALGSSSGATVAASREATAESGRPTATPLFDYPDETRDEPGAQTFVERPRRLTLAELPLWVAALTVALLITAVATLGVFVSRMNGTLEKKATQEDLDGINRQIAELKKGLADVSSSVQTLPSPEPFATPTTTEHGALPVPDEFQSADSARPEHESRQRDSRPPVQDTRAQGRTNARNGGRTAGASPVTTRQAASPAAPAVNTSQQPASEKAREPADRAAPAKSPSPAPSLPKATAEPPLAPGNSNP